MYEIVFTNDKQAIVDQLKVLVPTFTHDSANMDKMMQTIQFLRKEKQAQ